MKRTESPSTQPPEPEPEAEREPDNSTTTTTEPEPEPDNSTTTTTEAEPDHSTTTTTEPNPSSPHQRGRGNFRGNRGGRGGNFRGGRGRSGRGGNFRGGRGGRNFRSFHRGKPAIQIVKQESPDTSVYLSVPTACNIVYRAAGIIPYSLIKETGAAKILLGEEIRQNKLVWCAFGGRRQDRDLDIADCAARELNEESGFIWDDLLEEIKKSVNADKTLKIWEKKGFFGLFLVPVPYKENVQESYLEFKSNLIEKLSSTENSNQIEENQTEENQEPEDNQPTDKESTENIPTDKESTENNPDSKPDSENPSKKPQVEQPPQTTRTDRERLLLERRRIKLRDDNISAEKLGKTRLEYFDIFTLVDAVEKNNGCLNPEAGESEKKYLHDYFLELLKIPMVLTTIKVLPVRLNLRGTGVPYTWK